MGNVFLPLSGDVSQVLNPWTWTLSPSQGGQVGLFNLSVNVGQSTNPAVEQDVLSVASYGKQLGRIEDALRLVIDLVEDMASERAIADDKAVIAFRAMMYEIDTIKAQHGPARRPERAALRSIG